MSEPSQRTPIASSPITVILFAQALSTETPAALARWRAYLDQLGRPSEILLIQETRSEVTTDAVSDFADIGSTRVVTYERNAGMRESLNEAIRTVQHPLVVFCTCDKQYSPSDLDAMLKVIDQVDLVVGYRATGQAPPWRVMLDILTGLFSRIVLGIPLGPRVCWLGSEGFDRRWIARWIFGVRVHDPECPFRLVRREVLQRLPIQSGGPFVQVEILAKANHRTCLLAEEPVTWTPPALPASDAIPFGRDAWVVFREPEFGRTQDLKVVE